MTIFQATLPYPPSINENYRYGKNRVWLSPKVRAYRFEIGTKVCRLHRFGSALLLMQMRIYPPDKRRRDIDNCLKVAIDALQSAQVFRDDSQIMRLEVEKCEVREGGEVEVMIREWAL